MHRIAFTAHRRPALGALLALAAALPLLHADPSDDEQKALKEATQSYKDGAFDLASDRAAALQKKYPKSELTAQAELIEAQALYQLGRTDAAFAAFTLPMEQVPEQLRAETLFWQAESLLDQGKWHDAEGRYRTLLALPDTRGFSDPAQLGLAWAVFKQGHEADALLILQKLVKDRGTSPAGQQAQLVLAKIQLSKSQFKDAIASLEALAAAQPPPSLAFLTNYWLGEAYSADNQPTPAVTAYRKVTDDPKAFPKPLVAEAWLGLGRAEHALHQDDQAMAAYEQTYRLTENEPDRLEAFRSYLESARTGRQLPEAVTKLQEFAKTSDRSAPAALFAIGSVLAVDGQDDKAIGILESLLVAYGTSPWVPDADYQLGQLYARTGRTDQAVKALQSCISASTNPGLVRSARLQLGYVLLSQRHDYAGAAAQFEKIDDGTDAAAEDASYNYLLTQAYLNKLDTFTKAQGEFDKRFPNSPHAKAIALAAGQLLSNLKKTDDAKAVYQKAIASGGTGLDQLALLTNLADLQYQTNDLEGTYATCKIITDQFPNDALLASQRGILVAYELKKLTEEQVEQQLLALAQKYAKSPGAPEAYFGLGEFYFYRQDYVKAQDAFQQLMVNFPNSTYTDQACFYAGRAAFAHQDYAAAHTLLQKVSDKSPLKPDARLWDGRVYQQQHKFDQAVPAFDAVLATEKTGPRFVEAALLKGQSLFALGGQDASNYGKAVSAFDLILKSKEGSVADRNQAAVRSAKALEKMGQTEEAMALYLKVLYGRIAGDDSASPTPPEFYWQIEGGWQAAHIRETQKDWRGAIEIYKRMEQIGGAQAPDIHELINRIRRDNYIYE